MADVDLHACVSGDKPAWDAFVDRWSGVIYASVQRTVRGGVDRAVIDDIVQDVFVRLIRDDYRLLRRFDPGRAALSTWLTLVARSAAIDHLRKLRPATTLERAVEPAASPPTAVEGPVVPLHLLTGRQRLVLTLLFERDMAVEDVAGFLGVDAQTVRSTKHKALSRLREALQADPGEAEPGTSGGCCGSGGRTDGGSTP